MAASIAKGMACRYSMARGTRGTSSVCSFEKLSIYLANEMAKGKEKTSNKSNKSRNLRKGEAAGEGTRGT